MSIDHVLAVVPVNDFDAAHAWSSFCSAVPPTTCPWRVSSTSGGWTEIETVNKGVQLSAIRDPEGNTITFIGNFRVEY